MGFIDSYLEKLGNFFYKYIKRNLAHLEAEVHRSAAGSVQQTSTSMPCSSTVADKPLILTITP